MYKRLHQFYSCVLWAPWFNSDDYFCKKVPLICNVQSRKTLAMCYTRWLHINFGEEIQYQNWIYGRPQWQNESTCDSSKWTKGQNYNPALFGLWTLSERIKSGEFSFPPTWYSTRCHMNLCKTTVAKCIHLQFLKISKMTKLDVGLGLNFL